MDKNKVTIVAFCLLRFVFLDLSAIFWEKEYKKKYKVNFKNLTFNSTFDTIESWIIKTVLHLKNIYGIKTILKKKD